MKCHFCKKDYINLIELKHHLKSGLCKEFEKVYSYTEPEQVYNMRPIFGNR